MRKLCTPCTDERNQQLRVDDAEFSVARLVLDRTGHVERVGRGRRQNDGLPRRKPRHVEDDGEGERKEVEQRAGHILAGTGAGGIDVAVRCSDVEEETDATKNHKGHIEREVGNCSGQVVTEAGECQETLVPEAGS